MNESAAQKLAVPVLELMDRGADGARVAAAATGTWSAIATALTPIIGPLGFSALFARAVKLTCVEHGWLAGLKAPASDTPAFRSLHATLLQRPAADAAAAHASLLQAFCDVLSSLIGASLTERLLCTVWSPQSSRTSAEPKLP